MVFANRRVTRAACTLLRGNIFLGFKSMSRVWLAIAMAALLSACADNSASKRHGPPPHDPADYHGVPTDDRPPVMIETPPAQ